jgi:hypothetical protein
VRGERESSPLVGAVFDRNFLKGEENSNKKKKKNKAKQKSLTSIEI